MATPVGRTIYKKKDGILTLNPDHTLVTWTPNSGGPPTISLSIANITNLQQTPDTAAKVMLKIFEKAPDAAEATSYLFHFNTPEAKSEASAVRDLLSPLLAEVRSTDPSVPRASNAGTNPSTPAPGTPAPKGAANGGSGSATMAFASAVNSQQVGSLRWFDDASLQKDIELQQSLMKKDHSLHQTYMEAMATKPDSISTGAFNTQFWSTRVNMLRAHAIETNQKKGSYNVLSTVKPKTVDGELKLNISVEQVQMILAQHPLVKRIYNENVPKLSEAKFWSRFFLSKLSKKLRGERILESDTTDPLFDVYDPSQNTEAFQSKIMAQSVPRIIDVEGNAENQGGVKSGNHPDDLTQFTKGTLFRTLNSLSEKIMANVAPSDAPQDDGSQATYNELALRDLRGDAKQQRIMLNVKEQNQFFSKKEEDRQPTANEKVFATQNTADVLLEVIADAETLEEDPHGGVNLQAGIGFNDESDSEDDDDPAAHAKKRPHVGSRSALIAAEADISQGVNQRRAQRYGTSTGSSTLPAGLADRAALTHATTTEFLHQFWSAFLSGDPDRAAELQYLAESLKRSRARIEAVAVDAEAAKAEAEAKMKQDIKEHYTKTGKKLKMRRDLLGGGRAEVDRLMGPVVVAIDKAQGDYSRALAAEGLTLSTE
ncbi:BSD domain-containing protein [Sarocladium implicatum]|nr:BSD domain-containing protein [Sarocladium implicatum]